MDFITISTLHPIKKTHLVLKYNECLQIIGECMNNIKKNQSSLSILRIAALLCALAVAMILGSGCSALDAPAPNSNNLGDDASQAVEEQAGNEERDTFVVGFDSDFPPFGYIDDTGNAAGFDLELAQEVATRNNWTPEFRSISWESKDLPLANGTIDCIWNGFTIDGQESNYTWTEPYLSNSQVVVTLASSKIVDLGNLKDKIVVTQDGSSAHKLFVKRGKQNKLADSFKELRTVPKYSQAFKLLDAKLVDAIAIDFTPAKLTTKGKSKYKILGDPLSTEKFGVGFKLGNTELRDIVQETLIEMNSDGFIEKLCKKYNGQDIDYSLWLLR